LHITASGSVVFSSMRIYRSSCFKYFNFFLSVWGGFPLLVRAVVWSCSLWLASKRWHHMALPDVVVVAGVVVALWVIFFNAEIDFRFGLLLLASCSFDRKQNVVGHTSAPLFVFVARGRRKGGWVVWLFVFTLKLVKYELQFRYPIVTFDIFWGALSKCSIGIWSKVICS